jgi:hypothetical protein
MTSVQDERIQRLETALISYVEKYGFSDEASDYFKWHYEVIVEEPSFYFRSGVTPEQ